MKGTNFKRKIQALTKSTLVRQIFIIFSKIQKYGWAKYISYIIIPILLSNGEIVLIFKSVSRTVYKSCAEIGWKVRKQLVDKFLSKRLQWKFWTLLTDRLKSKCTLFKEKFLEMIYGCYYRLITERCRILKSWQNIRNCIYENSFLGLFFHRTCKVRSF